MRPAGNQKAELILNLGSGNKNSPIELVLIWATEAQWPKYSNQNTSTWNALDAQMINFGIHLCHFLLIRIQVMLFYSG